MKRSWFMTSCLIVYSFAGYTVSSWCIFTDRELNYQLEYPCSWQVEDHTRKKGMIRADLSHSSMGFQIRQYAKNRSLESFALRYVEKFKQDMETHWKGKMEFLSASCEQNRYWAHLRLKRADGQIWDFWEYIFADHNNFVAFQCGAPYNETQDAENVFEQIANSFQFL
ncbi:MAG: hypothetical protein CSA81_09330 [Acidobacteria bacterium]|nr:MAG: hypothetical protein CSA81_09330 [Acidobacteriota bacterium]